MLLLEDIVFVLFVVTAVTQVIIPLCHNKPTFYLFRRNARLLELREEKEDAEQQLLEAKLQAKIHRLHDEIDDIEDQHSV